MEKEYQVSWLKVAGVAAVVILILIIIFGIYPNIKGKSKNNVTSVFSSNINLMKEAGIEYFKNNNLPEKIGETKKVSLEELENRNFIVEFSDEKGKACHKDDSYVEATKKSDNDYTIKTYLSCTNKADYILTTITNSNNKVDNNENNIVIPNENNNKEVIEKQNNNISNNNKVTPQYLTNYNINYVDTCKNGNCLTNVYYTVTFDSNGGTSVASQTIKSGELAVYQNTVRNGYTFNGWYLNGTKYDFSKPVTSKINLVASWTLNNAPVVKNNYVVTFDSNGGSYVSSQIVVEGNTVSYPTTPTRSCYSFAGWYTNSSLTNAYNFNTAINKNITLYAKWIDNGSCNYTTNYTVNFVTNGGSYVNQQTIAKYNYAYEPTTTRSCYDFAGWYTNSNLTNRYYFNNPITSNLTLYAKWVDNGSCTSTYRVTFDSNGGSYVSSQTINKGYRVSYPSTPTRSGYTFIGWYYNGSLYNFNNGVYQNMTLTAYWEKDNNTYQTYCKIKTKTYYSTTYVSDDQKTTSYNWTIRFDELRAQNVKVKNLDYLYNYSQYRDAYNNKYVKEISMVGGNSYTYIPSADVLEYYSLKSNNFSSWVTVPYYKNGYWYTDAHVNISNYYGARSYNGIYFVPFYFVLSYTDLNDCVNDYNSNSYKYNKNDYEYVSTNTR